MDDEDKNNNLNDQILARCLDHEEEPSDKEEEKFNHRIRNLQLEGGISNGGFNEDLILLHDMDEKKGGVLKPEENIPNKSTGIQVEVPEEVADEVPEEKGYELPEKSIAEHPWSNEKAEDAIKNSPEVPGTNALTAEDLQRVVDGL